MKSPNPVGKLAIYYSSSPKIQALVNLVASALTPVASAITGSLTVLLQARAEEIREDRAITFFNELDEKQLKLTDELLTSESFIHRFSYTVKAALNTKSREKIKMFAKLLNSSETIIEEITEDGYEELIKTIEDLSYREFAVLLKLHKYEQLKETSNTRMSSRYWDQFTKDVAEEFQIEGLASFMARMERSGLYLRDTGSGFDYSGDEGATTPLFKRLVGFLSDPEE